MQRSDWTPAVLITATVSLMTAGLVWLVAPWGHPGRGAGPGDTIPRHRLQPQVTIWTGDLGPGLKAVLAPVWGDVLPDRHHDGSLNADLGLSGERALAYFRLLLFNTAAETRSLGLQDGGLIMLAEEGGRRYELRNLAAMAARGEIELDAGQEFTLRSLGALQESVEIPAGRYATLVVPFAGEPAIEQVLAVSAADGTRLRRRQIARVAFRQLIQNPDATRVKDL